MIMEEHFLLFRHWLRLEDRFHHQLPMRGLVHEKPKKKRVLRKGGEDGPSPPPRLVKMDQRG